MKRETKILIVLFVLAFVIRGIFFFSTPIKGWDETVYSNLGYDLSHNPFDYSVENNGWSDFIPGAEKLYSWPNIGFRAPLLPYILSLFYLLNLEFITSFFMVFIGALSVCLVYVLGKKMFDEKIGIYSAILFSFIPVHILYSGKILTEVFSGFFILLSFLSFWKGYEENNKKHKILFGVFLALAVLSRYTAIWIIPVFFLYFLARNKSLKFLKDKYLWYSCLAFILCLVPLFIYGITHYNNFLGAFIHGFKAALYSGGIQPWNFYFNHWFEMFFVIGIVFAIGLIYIAYKKDFFKKEIYFLLIWFVFFLGMAVYMPHKEDRFIIAIIPVIALISGYFLDKVKKYKKLILIGIIVTSLIFLSINFSSVYRNTHTDTFRCFLEANKFLKNQENALVITDESPLIYHYSKQATHFYPNPWSYESLKSLIENDYPDKNGFVFFTNFDMPLADEEHRKIKEDLDKNLEKVFECGEGEVFSIVYKFS
ncbi:MAG: glycosyltransferase family 39 protein [Nanoarchaeota archaeon]|nr:glycosyltransferase family 39 protein [Nanoarchaeota archaeon]